MKQIIILLVIIGLAGFLIFKGTQTKVGNTIQPAMAAEIEQIKATNDIDLRTRLYRQLIEKVGPAEAQEQLVRSGLPFDGQTHLLNHTVGDYLYEKLGSGGVTECRDYFLSSCYHGFVIRAVADKGFNGLKEIMDRCWEKGAHVAPQCSHAIGHGLLAWEGYPNLLKALEDCDRLATESDNFPIFNCHDGVFMENIWGLHEGSPSPERWVKQGDLVYPCNDPRIDEKYLNACWAEQPTIMYQQLNGDVKRVGEECLKVQNSTYQASCFDSLARQIHPILNGSVDETFRQCGLMPEGWQNPCLLTIVKAFFSVGDKKTPFLICNKIDSAGQDQCFSQVTGLVSYYGVSNQEKATLCSQINDPSWQQRCLDNKP